MDRSTSLQYLSLIFGLPGFLALIFTPYQAVAFVSLLLGLLIYVFKKVLGAPPWTVLDYQKTLFIQRQDGSLATITKKTKLRPNHGGQTEFMHRNIRADGECYNFRFGSRPVPPDDVKRERGEYTVHERFGDILPRRKPLGSELSYDLKNSYCNAEYESTSYTADYYTEKAKIEIYLSEGKPARNQKAMVRTGAPDTPLSKPNLSDDGRKITWEGKKLAAGRTYIISWNW